MEEIMKVRTLVAVALLGCLIFLQRPAHAQNLQAFINAWNGKKCGDGQCVALAHTWATADGASIPNHNFAYQYANTNPSGWKWVKNTPTGVPSPGDIVVWGADASVGVPVGHVAVFVSGNTRTFSSFDENWPTGSYCHVQSHSYTDVAGWLHRM